MTTESSSTLPPATLIRRLMAMIYDGLLMLGITFAYAIVVFLLRSLLDDDPLEATHGLLQITLLGGWWFCLAFYYVWCWRRSGQTLGMKSWRLQLKSINGGTPDWQGCWLRCGLAALSLAALGAGYLWCLIDRNGDCLHDKWSHTRTLLLPKPPKKNKK
ncbi:MAG: RDD family protein [Porticoccaceae bacterium]